MKDTAPHFPVSPAFKDASYIERYHILCQRLVQEQLYTTATPIAAPRTAIKTGAFTSFDDMTNLASFVTTFAGHIAAAAAL